jgi:hypothetical protein
MIEAKRSIIFKPFSTCVKLKPSVIELNIANFMSFVVILRTGISRLAFFSDYYNRNLHL